jgi:hypothetical protein
MTAKLTLDEVKILLLHKEHNLPLFKDKRGDVQHRLKNLGFLHQVSETNFGICRPGLDELVDREPELYRAGLITYKVKHDRRPESGIALPPPGGMFGNPNDYPS